MAPIGMEASSHKKPRKQLNVTEDIHTEEEQEESESFDDEQDQLSAVRSAFQWGKRLYSLSLGHEVGTRYISNH